MGNSALVDYIRISPNSTNPRNKKIDKITIHHMAGNLSIESCGAGFADPNRQASSNYGIGSDGRIGMYVEETNRSWCSGGTKTNNGMTGRDNDFRAVTIEVANDGGDPDWHVSDKAIASLIALCADICKRNGIPELNFTGDATGNLTLHNFFAYTLCPGAFLESKIPYIVEQVNKQLGTVNTTTDSNTTSGEKTLYRVQVGAYSVKSNAEAMLKKVKAAGFDDAFITTAK